MAKAKSIEENFERLEEIIEDLENNELTLEEAFKAYQAGIKLTAECSRQLDRVEKQIIVLKEQSDKEEEDNE